MRPPRERGAGRSKPRGAVAVAAEVDPGEHDLLVAVGRAPTDLAEHGAGRPAARAAAHARDHAEGTREAAPILDLDERSNTLPPKARLDTADRASGSARRLAVRRFAPPDDHGDVLGELTERALEIGGTARDEDAVRRGARPAGQPSATSATASCVTQHVLTTATSASPLVSLMPREREPLADLASIDVRDLAPEKVDRERRHPSMLEARLRAARSLAPADLPPRGD